MYFRFFYLCVVYAFLTTTAPAKSSCPFDKLVKSASHISKEGKEAHLNKAFGINEGEESPEPYGQIWRWEVTQNLHQFRETSRRVWLEMVKVPRARVQVRVADGANPDVVNWFVNKDWVFIPVHPYNTSSSVPFFWRSLWPFMKIETAGRLTASRSLEFSNGKIAITAKVGTNQVHQNGGLSDAKVSTASDIRFSIARTNYIQRVDDQIGSNPKLKILKDVMTIAKDGNGLVVRDVSPLRNGRYFIPALSIPYIGRDIARAHGLLFSEFWGISYAETAGRAKA